MDDGDLVPFKDAKVHVLTHALHYSTAVFEGLRCYSTEKGPAIFRLGEHVDRLFNSAKMYSMEMPYSKDEIAEAIIQTVRVSGLHECYIRPIAYYGYGEMGLTPTKNKVDVSIACWEWNMGESAAGKFTGAKCKVSSWVRIDSRVQPVKAKAASNYANAALARLEAIDSGYDEAIMLNRDGKVAEGSAENIFLVRGDSILTPPSGVGNSRGNHQGQRNPDHRGGRRPRNGEGDRPGRPVHGRRGVHGGNGSGGQVGGPDRPREDRRRPDGQPDPKAAEGIHRCGNGQGREVPDLA